MQLNKVGFKNLDLSQSVMNRQGLATISESYDSQDIGGNDRRDVGKVGSLGGPGHI
jgi:hypothetical protein